MQLTPCLPPAWASNTVQYTLNAADEFLVSCPAFVHTATKTIYDKITGAVLNGAARGGLRYESELTKNKFIEYSKNIASKEGYFDFAAHGHSSAVEIGSGQYNHRVAASLIEQSPEYTAG